ncbi:hypothetical protein J4Q44_G00284780 [Coregonus suidteri]|uniref:Uncharacterized protein n=1 Tax=Coregonus suidteri TaxID=861788 RepID=A0AAN8QD16_9TELE
MTPAEGHSNWAGERRILRGFVSDSRDVEAKLMVYGDQCCRMPHYYEQASLRQQVVEEDTEDWQRSPDFTGLERVGGVDLSFIKGDDVNACAQLVVLSYPDLELLYEDSQMVTLTAPYISGSWHSGRPPICWRPCSAWRRPSPACYLRWSWWMGMVCSTTESLAWRVTWEFCQGFLV